MMFTVNNIWGTEKEQDVLTDSLFGTVHLTSYKSNEYSRKNEEAIETTIHNRLKRKASLKERKSKKMKKQASVGSSKYVENTPEITNNPYLHCPKPVYNNEVAKIKKKKKKKKAANIEETLDTIVIAEENQVDNTKRLNISPPSPVEKQCIGNDNQINVDEVGHVYVGKESDNRKKQEKKKKKIMKNQDDKSKKKELSPCNENDGIPACDNILTEGSKEKQLASSKKHEKQLTKSNSNKVNNKYVGGDTEIEKSKGDRKRKHKKNDGDKETNIEEDEVNQSIDENMGGNDVRKTDNCTEVSSTSKKFRFQGSLKYSKFQNKIMEKLKGGQFRWINEKLYTCKSSEAYNIFAEDPKLFDVYHNGFHMQVRQWPQNPVDVIIEYIKSKSEELVVADFGCGDAKISKSVSNMVHSFDMVAVNERVTACDMKNVPLSSHSIDIAVFCLSLMGSNLVEFLLEARRVLKHNGIVKVAEVKSRFEDVDKFVKGFCALGFLLAEIDDSNKMFIMMEFHKSEKSTAVKKSNITLKPCIYKRR